MKSSICVLVLAIILTIHNVRVSGEWWGSRRNVRENHTARFECSCMIICHPQATCSMNCYSSCGGKRKRTTKDDGFVVLLPCKFEAWDVNNDGGIQMEEYIFQTRLSKNDSNGNMIFDRSDKDDDGQLSPEEFASTPIRKEIC